MLVLSMNKFLGTQLGFSGAFPPWQAHNKSDVSGTSEEKGNSGTLGATDIGRLQVFHPTSGHD